jgi:hypothetical protein
MTIKGSCHCGAIQFTVTEAPTEVSDCNCSFCSRRAPLSAYYSPDQFKLLTAPERISVYQWGSYMGTHSFCGVCGCAAFSRFPDFESGEPDFDKPRIGVNARLFEDFDLSKIPVRHLNGRDDW